MSPSTRAERGSALVFAIVATVLATGIIAVIVQVGISGSSRRGEAYAELSAGWAADSASERIRLALNGALMSENDRYELSQADLMSLVDDGLHGETALANTSPEIPEAFRTPPTSPADAGFVPVASTTMREPIGDGRFGYWQVVRVQTPDYVERMAVRVWVRAWVGNGAAAPTGTPESRIIVGEYRPRFFSDYMMVVNGPLTLRESLDIDGPVHYNGYFSGADAAPAGGAQVVCSGPRAAVTTSQPARITTSGCGVDSDNVNKPPLSFVNFRRSFHRMRQGCAAGASVRCFTGAGPWTVRLLGPSVNVIGAGGGTFAVADVSGLLFDGDVRVSGTVDGRLTIGADPDDAAGGDGSIRIIGDVGARRTSGIGNGLANSLGLFARSDVILDNPCNGSISPVRIDAAVMSQTGSLTLDPLHTIQANFGNDWHCTGGVVFRGPLVGQRAPLLHWQWDDGSWMGFANRRLETGWYDRDGTLRPHYRDNPPPFTPSDDNWQTLRWKPANLDCLKATGDPAKDCL